MASTIYTLLNLICVISLYLKFGIGVGYSSVGAARSALSSALIIGNRISFEKHPLVQQFMKGIFNLTPALPRQFVLLSLTISVT